MGWNTTVVVHNDALHEIENDPEFGKNLSRAITIAAGRGTREEVSAGHHCGACEVIESHHADQVRVVAVGGNYGVELGYGGQWPVCTNDEESKVKMLKNLAESLGYNIRKKPQKKA